MVVHQIRQQPTNVGWSAPPPGYYKINVDDAIDESRRMSSTGVIIRDCEGRVVVARSKVLNGMFEAETTETFAVEEGILLARERGLNHVVIESDSLSVV